MIPEVTVTLTIPVTHLAALQALLSDDRAQATTGDVRPEVAVATPKKSKAKAKAKPKAKGRSVTEANRESNLDKLQEDHAEEVAKASADDKEARFNEADAERKAIQEEGIDRAQLESDLRALLPQVGTEKLREAKTAAGIKVRLQAAEGADLAAYRKLADDLLAGLEGQI